MRRRILLLRVLVNLRLFLSSPLSLWVLTLVWSGLGALLARPPLWGCAVLVLCECDFFFFFVALFGCPSFSFGPRGSRGRHHSLQEGQDGYCMRPIPLSGDPITYQTVGRLESRKGVWKKNKKTENYDEMEPELHEDQLFK